MPSLRRVIQKVKNYFIPLSWILFLQACVCLVVPGPEKSNRAPQNPGNLPVSLPFEAKNSNERAFAATLDELFLKIHNDVTEPQFMPLGRVALRRLITNKTIPGLFWFTIESRFLSSLTQYPGIENKNHVPILCEECRFPLQNADVVPQSGPTITSPLALEKIAQQLNIDTWCDLSLVHEGAELFVNVSFIRSGAGKELLWSKNYSSADLIEKPKPEILKPLVSVPDSKLIVTLTVGAHRVPSTVSFSESENLYGLSLGLFEGFNLNRTAVGIQVGAGASGPLWVSDYPRKVESGTVIKLNPRNSQGVEKAIFIYGTVRNYLTCEPCVKDVFDVGAHGGLGIVSSQGFLALTGRTGFFVTLGRFAYIESAFLYSPPTRIRLLSDTADFKTKGGWGSEMLMGVVF